jgi:hypothetical protein
MLGGKVEELDDGGCLMINLLPEEPLSGAVCANTGAQHPGAVGPDVLGSKLLALGRVEADGQLPFVKESRRLLQCRVFGAENVDVNEVSQDGTVWTEVGRQVSVH